jgi:sugar phosphate isomerase/epimerase
MYAHGFGIWVRLTWEPTPACFHVLRKYAVQWQRFDLMRYAICNETWPNTPFSTICERARAHGYEALELAPFTLKEDPRDLNDHDAIHLVKTAQEHGIEILGLHWLLTKPGWLHITTPDAALRREMARFCGMLGGKIMVWGSPRARSTQPEWAYEDAFNRGVEVVRAVAEEAGNYGVTIAMEPLARTETNFLNTAEETIRFCKAVDHPACKLHLDVKAMSDESKPIPQIIEESKDWTVHFHTNDKNLLGPGMGDIDFHPILTALKTSGYNGWLSTEVFKYEPSPDHIAEHSIGYLKRVMAALG